MILVAPDKFKGTLTARQAADIIAMTLPYKSVIAPMGDGGEGTAEILASDTPWQRRDKYFFNPITREAVIDSSSIIGLQSIDLSRHDIMTASSAPLGRKVLEILSQGAIHVTIGIGGTSTCDGGAGFLEALGARIYGCDGKIIGKPEIRQLDRFRYLIRGLSDVTVPLVDEIGHMSALSFAKQKGAEQDQLPLLKKKLERIQSALDVSPTPFDGAGGGLGYAIAAVIGAPCISGAEYVLGRYNLDWDDIDLVITGEGKIDLQTGRGKVVDVVFNEARRRGIPSIAFGGYVDPQLENETTISTSSYFPGLDLSTATAKKRLAKAVAEAIPLINRFLGISS